MVQLVVPIRLLILTKTSNDELIIAVCTPMMKRIHTMVAHNSELVFIGSTGMHMHVDC